jgi:ketosteroid isomerase-like protein
MDEATVRSGYDAFSRGDLEGFLAVCAPDVVMHSSGVFPGFDPTYEGHDGVRRWWENLRDIWDHFEIRPTIEAMDGSNVLMHVTFYARGSSSGAEVTMQFWQVMETRDELCVHHWTFPDEESAKALIQDLKTDRPG